MPLRGSLRSCISLLLFAVPCKTGSTAPVDEPKPTPENTISIQLGDPVPAQKFDRSSKFWIAGVADRSGNPQPLLVMKSRGGVFLDKQPTAIMKDSLEQSLEVKAAGTSIADGARRKKNLQKNVEQDIEAALRDATRNFLRGAQLKEAVAALSKGAGASPAAAPAATASPTSRQKFCGVS